jgi:WD40 repeat protein
VAFSPDGRTLAAGGGGERDNDKLRLWDVASGKLLHELGSHYPTVDSIAFSPDGKVIASSGSRGPLYLWDSATGKELCRLWAYAEAIAFAPDGKTLATAGNDETIRFWEVPTGKGRPAPAGGHRGAVRTVAASKDGAVVVTAGGGESSIRLWDLASGKERRRIDASSTWFGGTGAMALSPDGKAVATDKGAWDTATGKFLLGPRTKRTAFKGQDYSIEAIAYSPDGKTLAMGTRDGGSGIPGARGTRSTADARSEGRPGAVPGAALGKQLPVLVVPLRGSLRD